MWTGNKYLDEPKSINKLIALILTIIIFDKINSMGKQQESTRKCFNLFVQFFHKHNYVASYIYI